MESHQYRPTAREELAVQIRHLLRLKEQEEGYVYYFDATIHMRERAIDPLLVACDGL